MEEGYYIPKKKKWLISLLLTVLLSVGIEIILSIYNSIMRDTGISNSIPWTFHLVWLFAILFTFYIIVRILNVSVTLFFLVLFPGMLISYFGWMAIPNSLKIIKPNFIGINVRIDEESDIQVNADENFNYKFPIKPGSLYYVDDPFLINAKKEAERNNEYLDVKGFLFWQTGLANGYIPVNIYNYRGGKSFFNHIALFFTIGPIEIFECLIMGIYSHYLCLLIAQIIYFIIFKEQVWWHTVSS
jgi:hypothetical protein